VLLKLGVKILKPLRCVLFGFLEDDIVTFGTILMCFSRTKLSDRDNNIANLLLHAQLSDISNNFIYLVYEMFGKSLGLGA